MTKQCSKCKESKPLGEFYDHKQTSDGYMATCKPCHKTQTKTLRTARTKRLLTENEVEAGIAKFLSGLGWRRQRNHVGRFRTESGARIAVGTVGFPDWTYRRALLRGVCEILHVETKSSAGQASAKQLEVIASLNHIGEPAVLAGSLDGFKDWYHDQGFTTDWRHRAVNPQLTKPVIDAAEFRVAV